MEIYLKTLSPLHIGNGEALRPIDYIVQDSVLYRITQKQLLKFINEKSLVSKFEEYISRKTKEIESLKENIENIDFVIRNYKRNNDKDLIKSKENEKNDFNRLLNDLERSINLKSFLSEISDILLNEFIESEKPTKFNLNFEIKNQIRGFIKTPTNKPYIPGTSIKGAIRTALLYKYLLSADKQKIISIIRDSLQFVQAEKQRLRNNFKPDKYKKAFADKLEQSALYCETENQDGKRKKNDEKFDIMKFLSVCDGFLQKDELILANIDLYLISKTRTNQGFVSIATKQTQAPCVEAIPENTVINTDIDFDIQFFLNVKDKFVNNSIKQGKDLIWIDLKQKVKNIFNLDIDTLNKDNLEEKKQEVFKHIFSALQQFSYTQFEAEMVWIKEFSEKDKSKNYSNKINLGFKNLFEQKGTLLHMGFATGFYGITEFLLLKSDNELKELLKQVLELFFIGDRPGTKHTPDKPYVANPDKFPKSRRFTEINNSLKPLGWVFISNDEESLNSISFAETMKENKIIEIPKEITPEHRYVTFKKNKESVLEAVILSNGEVEVYMPDGKKKTVKLVGGSADVGKVILISVYPDGKGNFKQASFKDYKK